MSSIYRIVRSVKNYIKNEYMHEVDLSQEEARTVIDLIEKETGDDFLKVLKRCHWHDNEEQMIEEFYNQEGVFIYGINNEFARRITEWRNNGKSIDKNS